VLYTDRPDEQLSNTVRQLDTWYSIGDIGHPTDATLWTLTPVSHSINHQHQNNWFDFAHLTTNRSCAFLYRWWGLITMMFGANIGAWVGFALLRHGDCVCVEQR